MSAAAGQPPRDRRPGTGWKICRGLGEGRKGLEAHHRQMERGQAGSFIVCFAPKVAARSVESDYGHSKKRCRRSTSSGRSYASRVSISVRGHIIDLAIGNPDILQLLIAQATKITPQPLPFPPLLKSVPAIPENADIASLRVCRLDQARCLINHAHRSILGHLVSTLTCCQNPARHA
jgi:hypothetical protein